MPTISVIIPTYNYARFLPESVGSVLAQTFRDFEVVVVDDGSTDNTADVVGGLATDPRVRYLRQENQGDAAARNRGVRNSSGRYLAFLDSDDLWLPAKLARQFDVMESRPGVSVVHTALQLLREEPNGRQTRGPRVRPPRQQEATLYEDQLYRNMITSSHSTALVRREALEGVGGFDATVPFFCDHDLWRRMAERHAFHCLDEVLVTIRKHGRNVSSQVERMFRHDLRYYAKLSREILPQHRRHLPRVAIYRYSLWAIRLLRAHRWTAAAEAFGVALRHSLGSPVGAVSLVPRLVRLVGEHRAAAAASRRPGDMLP